MSSLTRAAYGEDLDAAVRGDTSGGFADLLSALSRGERDQGSSANDKEAKEDAKALFKVSQPRRGSQFNQFNIIFILTFVHAKNVNTELDLDNNNNNNNNNEL